MSYHDRPSGYRFIVRQRERWGIPNAWYYDLESAGFIIMQGTVRYLTKGSCKAGALRLARLLDCEVVDESPRQRARVAPERDRADLA